MDIPTDWELYGDPFYWTQILFNLVENALKQNTEPGLSITVAAAKTQDACVITVTDTGVGGNPPLLGNQGNGPGPFHRETRRGSARRRHHRLQHPPPGNCFYHHHSPEKIPGRKEDTATITGID